MQPKFNLLSCRPAVLFFSILLGLRLLSSVIVISDQRFGFQCLRYQIVGIAKHFNIQSSPAISNSQGTRQKVRDSVKFEIAHVRDSESQLQYKNISILAKFCAELRSRKMSFCLELWYGAQSYMRETLIVLWYSDIIIFLDICIV